VRAGLALTDRPSGVDEAIRVRDQCLSDGDPWGAAISSLLGGLGAARRGTPANQLLNQAGQRFRTLQARTFEALASVALATCGGAAADEAGGLARSTGTATMRPLIERFIGVSPSTGPVPSTHVHAGTPMRAADADVGPLRVQCLGRFHIAVCGTELDLDCLRPRARNLLKLLAIHPDSGLHRETIVEALWPDGTAESGIRNLHVAASAVRRALATAGLPEQLGVRRQGEAYRLVLPSTEASDLAHFLELAAAARAAAARDDHDEAMAAAGAALDLYGGELLIEDGPLEFAVRERSRVAALHQSVAAIAAGEHLRRSDHRAAIDTCEATILEHPYADELWRLLVRAHHERGDLAADGQAQARYDHVLAELMA
jgi:DNA-binding SARP family transcriptional activator